MRGTESKQQIPQISVGGKLVLVQLTIDDQGQFVGNTKAKKVSVYHKMCELWRRMVDDDTITEVRESAEESIMPLRIVAHYVCHFQ